MTREELDKILDGWTGYDHERDEYRGSMMMTSDCWIGDKFAWHGSCPNKTGYCAIVCEGQKCCLDDKDLRDALWKIVERAVKEELDWYRGMDENNDYSD